MDIVERMFGRPKLNHKILHIKSTNASCSNIDAEHTPEKNAHPPMKPFPSGPALAAYCIHTYRTDHIEKLYDASKMFFTDKMYVDVHIN